MLSKFSVTALIASGALLMGAASVAAESSDPIKIAINSWTGQHISAHISGSVLQKAGSFGFAQDDRIGCYRAP